MNSRKRSLLADIEQRDGPYLWAICQRCPSKHDALDLYQQVWANVADSSRWPPKRAVKQWRGLLCKIFKNLRINGSRRDLRYMPEERAERRRRRWRDQRPRHRVPNSRRCLPQEKLPESVDRFVLAFDPDPVIQAVKHELSEAIRQRITSAKNGDKAYKAFLLFVNRVNVDEIGWRLGCSAPTVRRRRDQAIEHALAVLAEKELLSNLIDYISQRLGDDEARMLREWRRGSTLAEIATEIGDCLEDIEAMWDDILEELAWYFRDYDYAFQM